MNRKKKVCLFSASLIAAVSMFSLAPSSVAYASAMDAADPLSPTVYSIPETTKMLRHMLSDEADFIPDRIADDTAHIGTIGRLYIPDSRISTALYEADQYDGDTSQAITDAADSAVFMQWRGGQPIIGDHKNQGFDGLYDVEIGTISYIRGTDETKVYVCVWAGNRYNDGEDLYTEDWEPIEYLNQDGLLMYTCNEDWQHVTLTMWQRLDA